MKSSNGRPEVVVITGASAGVGRAAVREFARRGAHIGLVARGEEGLLAAKREVEQAGGQALALSADVSDAQAVERAASAVEDRFGPIDVWVNDAMVSVFSPFKEMTADEFRRVTEVTYLGFVHGTMAALKRMLPRDRGTIVQVGSALAYRGIPLQSAYCGAKHAMLGFTESVRCELIHDRSNVWLTMVQMPALNTPQFGWVKSRLPRQPQPVPPIYEPEVAAEAIYFAAHHRRRQVFVGMSTVVAIEGNKVLPGTGDRYLGAVGYDSQMTDQSADPERPNNLWQPLPGDAGARGTFSNRAHQCSWQLWATMHRPAIVLAGLGVLGAAMVGLAGRSAHRAAASHGTFLARMTRAIAE
jgi:NAD(P)-dependent dehydrogenase (short-subunit alcohol dehydrogenase family)